MIYSCEKPPCFVFDLEGTLSNHKWREHFYSSKEYDQYNILFPFDGVNEKVFGMFDRLSRFHFSLHGKVVAPEMIILTAKHIDHIVDVTHWLNAFDVRFGRLLMRPNGNYKTSPFFKREAIFQLSKTREIKMIFDDRKDVCDLLYSDGFPVINVQGIL